MSNSKDTDKRQPSIAVNSLDYVANVKRLSTCKSRINGIYSYGLDNNYPHKVKQLALRSSSLIGAIKTESKFVTGLSFDGAKPNDIKMGTDVKVNRNGLSAYNMLRFAANELSNINFAIHVNFNALGEAVEFTPIQYEFVRIKTLEKDDIFQRYIISNMWQYENMAFLYGYQGTIQDFYTWIKKSQIGESVQMLNCFDYDPDPVVVREQISMSGGIENYPGQLYYSRDTMDIYQLAQFDPVIDDAQFEAEAKLYGLSSVQNGFSAGGVFRYPANIENTKESEEVRDRFSNLKGAENANRLLLFPYMPGQEPQKATFEPMQLPNIDKLFPNQKMEAQNAIYQLYNQPSVLNGKADQGMFNQQTMEDAYTYYNSITADQRMIIETAFTELFANSNIDIKLPIEIEPLHYGEQSVDNSQNDDIRQESQARLKGTVGGVQGVLQIQSSVSEGTTQYESGIEILKNIYGYSDEQARKILGEPVQKFSENVETVNE